MTKLIRNQWARITRHSPRSPNCSDSTRHRLRGCQREADVTPFEELTTAFILFELQLSKNQNQALSPQIAFLTHTHAGVCYPTGNNAAAKALRDSPV